MASINPVGLVGMIELGSFSRLPIHAHRNGWGALTRHPLLRWFPAAGVSAFRDAWGGSVAGVSPTNTPSRIVAEKTS